MMKYILETKSLNVGYKDKLIVDNVNIKAKEGDMICLLGANGSGKSTILRTISGMLEALGGSVYIDGKNLSNIGRKDLSKIMALILTERINSQMLTAYEIVSMGRNPHTGFFAKLSEKDHKIIRKSLKSVNAENLSYRFFSELSDGEKQKVMIARALAQEPRLIILDEPTSHLDIRHKIEVLEILSHLCKTENLTVIMALHDIELAIKVSQYILMIKDNSVSSMGMPEEIINGGKIQELFDIQEGIYSDKLGNVELTSDYESKVFVVGGGGTGAMVYRALKKAAIGFDTGIIYCSDIDYNVAFAISNTLVSEKDFVEISQEKYNIARDLITQQDIVIDTGFPIGDYNTKNFDLIKFALLNEKKVFSIRENRDVFENDKNLYYFEDIKTMIERIVEELDE